MKLLLTRLHERFWIPGPILTIPTALCHVSPCTFQSKREPIGTIALQEEKTMVNLKECGKNTIFSRSFLQRDTNEDIRNYFRRFGDVIKIRRHCGNNRILTWIEFASPESCSAAVEEQEHIFHNRKIAVENHEPTVRKRNCASGSYLSGTSEAGKRRENTKRTGSGQSPSPKELALKMSRNILAWAIDSSRQVRRNVIFFVIKLNKWKIVFIAMNHQIFVFRSSVSNSCPFCATCFIVIDATSSSTNFVMFP